MSASINSGSFKSSDRKSKQSRPSSFAALHHRDFRLFWGGQLVSVTGSQMQLWAINWHIYLLTKSAFALGMVGLARVVPIILCSLAGGVVADVIDRKRLMLCTQAVMMICASILALVTALGLEAAWPIYLLTGISSAATAFDAPARQSIIPALVPARDFPNAVSLGLLSFQVATVIGPMLTGFALAAFGPAIVYAVNALSFLAVIAALLLIRTNKEETEGAASAQRGTISFAALTEGLRFVWRTPVIVQTMMLDFIATFFASANALLPIFAAEILHVGEDGYGLLAAAQAIGSVVTALLMARWANWPRPGAKVLIAVAVYGLATLIFGLSRAFWLSFAMLVLAGAADTVSTVIRQTIRQLITPDRLRGRMTSVNMIFFMGGPQLGELEAGIVAQMAGAPFSVVFGGIGCLLAVFITALRAKELWRYRIPEAEEAKSP